MPVTFGHFLPLFPITLEYLFSDFFHFIVVVCKHSFSPQAKSYVITYTKEILKNGKGRTKKSNANNKVNMTIKTVAMAVHKT